MTYAIELFFDAPSETRIFSLWDTFAGFGAPSMRSGDQRPHVTLAVADSVDLLATRQLLDSFALAQAVSDFLCSFRLFSSERVAFLVPREHARVAGTPRAIFLAVFFSSSKHGRTITPASWIPHCTLTVGLATEQLSSRFDAVHSFGLLARFGHSAVEIWPCRVLFLLYRFACGVFRPMKRTPDKTPEP